MMTSEIFELLVRVALSGSVAVAIVMLMRAPLRSAFGARVAYAFWVLVPIAMLANFLPAQQITIVESTPVFAVQDTGLAVAVERSVSDVVPTSVLGETPVPVAVPGVQQKGLFSVFSISDVIPLLVAFWMAGALFSLLVLVLKQRRFLKEHGLKNIKRRFHVAAREDIGPVVIGILKPFIVVPKSFEKKFNKVERNLILAHEREHIRSGDLRINAVAAVVQCLNWFNPVVHYAMRAFRVDQELACDERVMKRHGSNRRTYGAALLKSQVGVQSAPLGCMWGSAGASPLKQRLALLAKPKMTAARRGVGAAVCLASAMAVGTAAWATLPAEYTFIAATQEDTDQQESVNQRAEDQADIDAQLDAEFDAQIEALEDAALTAEQVKEIVKQAEKTALAAVPNPAEIEALVEVALAAMPSEAEIEALSKAAFTPEKLKEISEQAQKAALASVPSQAEIEAMVEVALEAMPTEAEIEALTEAALAPEIIEEIAKKAEQAALAAVPNRAEIEAEVEKALHGARRAGAEAEEMRNAAKAKRKEVKEKRKALKTERTSSLFDTKGRALANAVDEGRTSDARALIEDGANVNYVMRGDGTPLMLAIRQGDDELVQMLIDAGADVNLPSQGDGNPLIVAAVRGDKKIARMLIAAGADVNGYVKGDETPLINAAQQGNLKVAKYLIDEGADVNLAVDSGNFFDNITGNKMRTPLGQAEKNGHDRMVKLLKEHGAQPVPKES